VNRRIVAAGVIAVLATSACTNSNNQAVKTVKTTVRSSSSTTATPAPEPSGPGCNFSSTPTPKGGGAWAVIADVFVTAPVVDAGAVYAGANSADTPGGCIFALDPTTGELKWQTPSPITPGARPIPVGKIVVASVIETPPNVALVGLDTVAGQRRWRVPIAGGVVAPPALIGGLVYVVGIEALLAVDPATGKVRWKVDRKPLGVASGPAGTFATFADNDTTSAIEARKGALKWSTPLGTRSAVVKAVTATTAVLENAPNDLYALDAVSGHQLWFQNMPGSQSSPVAVDGDALFVSTDDGKAYRLEARTGRITWSATIGLNIGATPLVAGDQVVFAASSPSAGFLSLDKASGQQRWRYGTLSPITSEFMRVNDEILAGTQKGLLCRIDLTGVRHSCVELVGEAVGAVNRTLTQLNGRTFVRIGNQTIAAG
jgi:outer membrane protein assembly factor BamB